MGREKYDPAVYGRIRARFLQRLDKSPRLTMDSDSGAVLDEEESRRQDIIQQIKDKKLVILK